MLRMKKKKKSAWDDQHLVVRMLGHLCPGQDAQVTFKTVDHREIGGYYQWKLVDLVHTKVGRKDVEREYKGKTALKAYHQNICCRRWRWKDMLKLLAKWEAAQ